MLRCKCVRRPRKRVEDISAASDMRGRGERRGGGRCVDGQSVGKIETARASVVRVRMRCYTPWRGEKRTLVHDRWPRLDRSIIQGFALDDVDGLPGRFLLRPESARPGALMRQPLEVIIPEASFFDPPRSPWSEICSAHLKDLKIFRRPSEHNDEQTN